MKVRTWFTRELLREHLPEKYHNMNTTKETNMLNRLLSWGYLEKGEHNQWIFVRDEIEDIEDID